jgi:hypothetical protein
VGVALVQNRAQGIRLHRDFEPGHKDFLKHILPLPAQPDTPPLSVEDIDYLQHHGQDPEALNRGEKISGYRVRTEDGREIRVMRPPDDDLIDVDED